MADDDKPQPDLVSEVLDMISCRDGQATGPKPEPAPRERPEPTPIPSQGQEYSIDTLHELGIYKSKVCRDLQELLDSNSKYRKKRLFGSKEPNPSVVAYVQRSLGMQNIHPFNRIKMVRKAIADAYFTGYEIDSLMKSLDRFCEECDADRHIYKDSN